MKTLRDVAAAGFCIDEFARWCQGNCQTYAEALIRTYPRLKLGVLDGGRHFFAHDDKFAYDAAGRHALPHHGIHGDMPELDLDVGRDWYGSAEDNEGATQQDFDDALQHAKRNSILTGQFGARKRRGSGRYRNKP